MKEVLEKEDAKLLETITEKIRRKRKTLEKKTTFQHILKMLDEVPEIVGERYTEYIDEDSWERGLVVKYQKNDGKWGRLKTKAFVIFKDAENWYEDTRESIAEQLFDLFVKKKIDFNSKIRFEFIDWLAGGSDRIRTITVPFVKLLPEVFKIVQEKIFCDNEDYNYDFSEYEPFILACSSVFSLFCD